MAQAARSRPHPPAGGSSRERPHLRAVSPPRRPSPQVIRRRRAVALGGLAGLIGLPLAILALTGGGPSSDAGRIRELLAQGATEPASLCDHLSTGMLRAAGGHDACVKASPQRGPAGDINSIRVNGDTAQAIVIREDGTESVRLVRQDGDWKVDDVR